MGVWLSPNSFSGSLVGTGNSFTNSGIAVFVSEDSEVEDVAFNLNNFVGNDVGVSKGSGEVLDATCNWWGDADGPSGEGPGSGDSVSEDVEFLSWLVDVTPQGDCFGGLESNTVTVALSSSLGSGGLRLLQA